MILNGIPSDGASSLLFLSSPGCHVPSGGAALILFLDDLFLPSGWLWDHWICSQFLALKKEHTSDARNGLSGFSFLPMTSSNSPLLPFFSGYAFGCSCTYFDPPATLDAWPNCGTLPSSFLAYSPLWSDWPAPSWRYAMLLVYSEVSSQM